MTERVKINGNDAVVVMPSGDGKGPGVIVLQEYWGINDQLKGIASAWADAGFIAVVPDLYKGKLAKTSDEAMSMMKALDFGAAVGEIAGAAEWVKAHARSTGKVAVTGYCMGGALTLATAVNVRGLSAAVAFYGFPGDLDWSKIDAPLQMHFAQHDDLATVASGEKIKAGVTSAEFHVYDAQHAFCNDARPEVYNADACKLAWQRTLEFVRKHTA
jgi:carboxymethylenebutenolidase